MYQPNFVITDAEVIKQITIKDFDSFVNHDTFIDESIDKLFGKSLFQMVDERWKNMRSSLSPIFTSAKMKMMFGILTECAQEFVDHFDKKPKTDKIIVDVKDKFSRYTINGISTAALGFKSDCLENDESFVYKLAMGLSTPDFSRGMKALLASICKPLYKLFGLQLFSKTDYDFFKRTIVDVMDERDANGSFRPDVVQLLLQMKKGQLDKNERSNDKDLTNFAANAEYDVGSSSKVMFDKEDFMAQGFIFFGAGFDTTQKLLQMTAYELAKNRNIQDELISEVDAVLSDMEGKPVSYEALHKMKFMDQVISEVLRLHPPTQFTNRECSKDYFLKFDNGQTVPMKKGDLIFIPIQSIHRDEKYFENPNNFDPRRFEDGRKELIVPGSYIPFGEFLKLSMSSS
jgi:cytochrome P450 family 9